MPFKKRKENWLKPSYLWHSAQRSLSLELTVKMQNSLWQDKEGSFYFLLIKKIQDLFFGLNLGFTIVICEWLNVVSNQFTFCGTDQLNRWRKGRETETIHYRRRNSPTERSAGHRSTGRLSEGKLNQFSIKKKNVFEKITLIFSIIFRVDKAQISLQRLHLLESSCRKRMTEASVWCC